MIVYRIHFLFFLLSFFMPVGAANFLITSQQEARAIADQIPEPFILSDYSYESDIALSAQEFEYLTDFKKGKNIQGADLARALFYLFCKDCFSSIAVALSDTQAGKHLHMTLTGKWRFEKLKVTGVLVGREWYRHYYLMDPGDAFDEDKHAHSLKKIKHASYKDGFFNTTIKTEYVKNPINKSVIVHLTIKRGSRFSIGNVQLNLNANALVLSHEQEYLKEQLYKRFIHHRHVHYAKSALESQAAAIRTYLSHRGYLLASIDLQETIRRVDGVVDITWNIDLGKKRNFVFFGAQFFSYNQLLDRILQFGRSAWVVPATILADELADMYHKKGFWDVHIEGTDESDRALFVITEGKRGVVSGITIKGAHAFDHKKLLKKCFYKIKRSGYFDHGLLQEGIDTLADHMYGHGFTRSKIVGHESVRQTDGTYHLFITVDQGMRQEVEAVSIVDFPDLQFLGPFASFAKRPKPALVDAALIQEQKEWLSSQMSKRGYPQASMHHEIVEHDGKKELVWHILPGRKIHFGKTIVQGSGALPFDKLLREVRYTQHALWDQEKIRQSFMRLKDRQLFDSVAFVPMPLDADQTERPIFLKLHQDDPFELRIRAGLGLQHIRQYQTFNGLTYKVGGTFLVKNPSNSGDYFRFDTDVARSHREVNFKYFYPWIFGFPFDGLLHTYAIKYDQPGFIGSKNNLYTVFQNGFLGGLRFKNPYLDVGLNIGFEVGRTRVGKDEKTKKQAADLACAIEFDSRLLNKNIPFFFLEPTMIIDRLDSNINPTRGMFTLMSLKGMFPTTSQFSNSYFIKLLVEHSWFVPLKQAVAAFRVRFGHIFHRNFCDIMPNERFYLGGSHSIRSYVADLAPPLGCFVDGDGNDCFVPRGGKTMLNLNAELRLPTYRKFGVVLFTDTGLLCGDDFKDFNSSNVVGGSGVGLRYFTPIGPLRLDLAWKWKKHIPQEHRFNWYLTFGQAF